MVDFLLSGDDRRFPQRDVIRAQNAIIEEINIGRDNTGFVTISYGVRDNFNTINMELVTLIVTRETQIRDRSGRNLSLRNLREGMMVNAVFSSAMTRSIPPQSRAFQITVVSRSASSEVTVGIVSAVDPRNRFLYVRSPSNRFGQIRFVITDRTTIMNRNGNIISLRNLRPGQRVRVEHANFQTASIPPQTTAFAVLVL